MVLRRFVRVRFAFLAFFALAVVSASIRSAAQSPSTASDRIWFSPGPGTFDYVDLFEHPEEWQRARGDINVFKFYQQHTQLPPPANVGPNSYDALVSAGAFRQLTGWGIKIAMEAGAVKEFYCTSDASGMATSIQSTLESLDAIARAGGSVTYLAMDEPWAAGRSARGGGPAPAPTAARVP